MEEGKGIGEHRGQAVTEYMLTGGVDVGFLALELQAQEFIVMLPAQGRQQQGQIRRIHGMAVQNIPDAVLQVPVGTGAVVQGLQEDPGGMIAQVFKQCITAGPEGRYQLIHQHSAQEHIAVPQIDEHTADTVGILIHIPDTRPVEPVGLLVLLIKLVFLNLGQGNIVALGLPVVLEFHHALNPAGHGDHREHIVMYVNRIVEKVGSQGAQFGKRSLVCHQTVDGGFKGVVLLKQLQHHGHDQILGLINAGYTRADALHFRSCDEAVPVRREPVSKLLRNHIDLIPFQFPLPVIQLNSPKTVMTPVSVDLIVPKQVIKFIQDHLQAQTKKIAVGLYFPSHCTPAPSKHICVYIISSKL